MDYGGPEYGPLENLNPCKHSLFLHLLYILSLYILLRPKHASLLPRISSFPSSVPLLSCILSEERAERPSPPARARACQKPRAKAKNPPPFTTIQSHCKGAWYFICCIMRHFICSIICKYICLCTSTSHCIIIF